MAYLITATFTKPNAETKLFNENNEAEELANIFKAEKQKYRANGTLLSERTDRTSDGLQVSYASLWKSKEDYDHYMANEICQMFWAERKVHNEKFGIKSDKKITEV